MTAIPNCGPSFGIESAVTSPYLVLDNFLPIDLAKALRADIDAHFSAPNNHQPSTHQVWNYWYVPELYTYLRTTPEKVIERGRVESFMRALGTWSVEALGIADISWPYLSLYVCNCVQEIHNDSKNGRFGFVYSLTNDDRRTDGGETIILNDGDLFRRNLNTANAGRGFYAAIEPRFNRLLVFDDRMPHAVSRLEGSMDPREGRFVLHGHIGLLGHHGERDSIVVGALHDQQVRPVVQTAMLGFRENAFARSRLYHGPLILRLQVGPQGVVVSCRILVDRVISVDVSNVEWPRLRMALLRCFEGLKFPPADGPTTITQPILFGEAAEAGASTS
jgi:hypothetical protein